jgi:ribosomal protein S27AE
MENRGLAMAGNGKLTDCTKVCPKCGKQCNQFIETHRAKHQCGNCGRRWDYRKE